MEVVVPVQDLHFDSACTSPYVSAPSSPKLLGEPFDFFRHYTSAPTSPTRASAIYARFDAVSYNDSLPPAAAASGNGFDLEEKPGTTKPRGRSTKDEQEDVSDFVFEFSGHLDKDGLPVLTTADELFEEGRIRPLKPPRRVTHQVMEDASSVASSPRSPKQRGLWSPCHRGSGGRGEEFEPFSAATVDVTRDRGSEKKPNPPSFSSSRRRKGWRSLSPLREGGLFRTAANNTPPPPTVSTAALKTGGGSGSKKWRLMDLLLFRNASEGRATGNRSKDPLRKYTLLSPPSSSNKKATTEDLKNSSFRSTDSSGSIRRRRASSHEMHYAANRAASEELKKKTALPYRQSLFGCLRFNPAVLSISRAFDSRR
ncbi:uncharacterized protein LOC103992219 [Musa acuminata AAA Group]|uniref:uncharacterized protein LOC103992219 n=1 Tax=Musa acuminata AAA Group TaxID=214697 RepID=UPI0031D64C11